MCFESLESRKMYSSTGNVMDTGIISNNADLVIIYTLKTF